MADAITPEELGLLDEAFADFPALAVELAAKDDVQPRILARLLESAGREYQHLKLGLLRSGAMVAWACRNLLELHIWTRYVLATDENAGRFAVEQLNDGIETYDSFQSWLARNDPGLVPEGIDEALRELMERRTDTGLGEGEHLRMKRVAADAGLADEYANMLRVSGKLAHPNAFSILAGEPVEVRAMTPILFRAGAGHGLEIFRLVKLAYNPASVDWNIPRSSQ